MASAPPSGWPARARRRLGRRGGLGRRSALATTLVALLAVIITGAVFLGQLGDVGEGQARRVLGRQADLVVALYGQPEATAELRAGVTRAIGSQQVSLLVLGPRGAVRTTMGPIGGRWVPALPAATLRRLAGTHRTDVVRTTAGRRVVVATRPLPDGSTVVLVQPASQARELTSALSRRLLVALVIALAVATAAGLLLARLLARPLRALSAAAGELASGRRDVAALALPAGGPAEIAEVAEALGGLATALTVSEARQREFLLSVSHELRTPLTAIRGFAEALADGVTPVERTPDTGRVILDEALRLDRLVQDLLDLARLDADDFRVEAAPVDLTRFVADAAEVWHRRCAAEGVELRVEVPAGPVVAVTDAVRLRQILDGLAENALRLVPAGAPIVLAARAEVGGGERAGAGLVGGERAGAGLAGAGLAGAGLAGAGPLVAVLEVRDGGPGLTDDDLAVAFERSALYERYRGLRPVSTGLGLALVARLASRLGGRAYATAAPEGGAAFTIRLPLADRPGADAGPRPRERPPVGELTTPPAVRPGKLSG
ncbi:MULTISPECIES: sensor histidine kinase [Pseudofrankia]|uniref:sensor histidine kinase n=1 Tax=Pseudofrankia TaxID=2994363 RepID=UPI000234BCE3|nr:MULTISPECIES: HAMP domain-containing sensor histidine kinase [Pseudofrankia]OHV32417.1 two-component sensor histidine kinase [Pseudofrankia sp. EUN1h]